MMMQPPVVNMEGGMAHLLLESQKATPKKMHHFQFHNRPCIQKGQQADSHTSERLKSRSMSHIILKHHIRYLK